MRGRLKDTFHTMEYIKSYKKIEKNHTPLGNSEGKIQYFNQLKIQPRILCKEGKV